MGGVSPEREISLESGKVCLQAIKDLGYSVQTLDPDYNIITSLTELTLILSSIACMDPGERMGISNQFLNF